VITPTSLAAAPAQAAPARGSPAASGPTAIVKIGPSRRSRSAQTEPGSGLASRSAAPSRTPLRTPAVATGTRVSSTTTTRSGLGITPRSWIGFRDARTPAKIGAPRRSAP
jgi:hypothetical protein